MRCFVLTMYRAPLVSRSETTGQNSVLIQLIGTECKTSSTSVSRKATDGNYTGLPSWFCHISSFLRGQNFSFFIVITCKLLSSFNYYFCLIVDFSCQAFVTGFVSWDSIYNSCSLFALQHMFDIFLITNMPRGF